MKYLLQILVLVNISLLADIAQIQSLYDNGQYEKAITAAKAYEKGYTDPNLHLLWAKSARALGRIAEAMSAYERVTLLDESNTEARVALVELYRTSNIPELATKMKNSLKKHKLTPQQAMAIKEKGLKKIKAKASLSIGYDSNINIYPDEISLLDYNATSGATKKIDTLFGRFVGSVTAIDDLDEKGEWYARFGFGIFNQHNEKEQYFNITIGSIEIGPGYVGETYSIYLPYGYNITHYLGKDLFEQSVFNPRVNFYISENIITTLNLRFAHRNYFDDIDKDMNSGYGGMGFGLFYKNENGYVYVNLQGEEHNTGDNYYSTRRFMNSEASITSIGIKQTLSSKLIGKLDFKHKNIHYFDGAYTPTNPDFSRRHDYYSQAQLKISYNYADNIEYYISGMGAINHSNYLPAEYKKNVTMFGINIHN